MRLIILHFDSFSAGVGMFTKALFQDLGDAYFCK